MHPSTQISSPTLGVDKKNVLEKYSMFYKTVISLSICGLRDMGYAKRMKKKKILGHVKVPSC